MVDLVEMNSFLAYIFSQSNILTITIIIYLHAIYVVKTDENIQLIQEKRNK